MKCHVMHIWYKTFYFASFIFIVASSVFFKKKKNYLLTNMCMNMFVKEYIYIGHLNAIILG